MSLATSVDVVRRSADGVDRTVDVVAVEEPLEIRVAGPDGVAVRVAVTMRTPGHDAELAIGFLLGEGLIDAASDLGEEPRAAPARGPDPDQVVTLALTRPFDRRLLDRNFYATSSCGVCGKAALDFVEVAVPPLGAGPVVPAEVLLALPDRLRAAQAAFATTGGLHAAARFDDSGELWCVREDVGRHNALDKVIGRAFLDGAHPLPPGIVMVSGRASFELVQKAALAGATILCAVSAPSSLAVRLAERVGLTLVGFLRDERFNVYAHAHRVAL
jgi:FdhD protein